MRSILGGVRARVLVAFTALLLLSTAASVLVLRQVLLNRIGDQVERTLQIEVDELRNLAGDREDGGQRFRSQEQLFDRYFDRNAPPADAALLAFTGDEAYRGNSTAPEGSGLVAALTELGPIDGTASGDVDTPAGTARYIAVPVTTGNERGSVIAAGLLAGEREQVESAVRIAVGVSIVVVLLAGLFIWLAAGRAVAPLHALARTARAIGQTDLGRRIPVRGNDELADLGRTFNSMLDRLQSAFADQKDFLTDVSHELRTPITVIRGHLETVGDSPAEREEAVAVIQDELDRMSRFVDDLLLLAMTPRPDFLRVRPIDLDLFTHDLFAKARSLGARDWRLEGTGVGILVADQQRLTQAVMNLATNAVRHTREGEPIWIGSSLSDDRGRLWVRDTGPGIEPDEQERIFERFARATRSGVASSDGTGLGLSIVRAIAEVHGGTVELESSPGSGATFTIVIPATAPSDER